jgi:hypothetical protein
MTRNSATETRGRPFRKGNPGKPRGARNKATVAAESLLDGEAEALTRAAIDRALEGDSVAMRLCLERILPVRKDRPIRVELPHIDSLADASVAAGSITVMVADGQLTPTEGQSLAGIVEVQRRALESDELERRVARLEGK